MIINLEDIYIAINTSEKMKSINLFFDKYLKGFKGLATYYEYPQYFGKIEFETDSYREMLDFVLKKSNRKFNFYFENNQNKEFSRAMIFINKDGSIFFGLGVFTEYLSKYESLLKEDFNTNLMLIFNETILPDNYNDFKVLFEQLNQ